MRAILILAVSALAVGCQGRQEETVAAPPAATAPADAASPAGFAAATAALTAGCQGAGSLHARLRGAVDADLNWRDAVMHCEGGPRPDGRGVRIALAGPLQASSGGGSGKPLTLRFIFGIAERDVASGTAQALPTNVTVIIEGDGRMFATRGDERCAVEELEREPMPGPALRQRVQVRGYCLDPAASLNGDEALHIPTFEFSGVVDAGEQP
jgi:hypothetical protein